MKISEAVKALPRMLAGDELLSAMAILPKYDDSIRKEDAATRLMALSELYRIYLPSQMSHETYCNPRQCSAGIYSSCSFALSSRLPDGI